MTEFEDKHLNKPSSWDILIKYDGNIKAVKEWHYSVKEWHYSDTDEKI